MKAVSNVKINGLKATSLMDTGSSDCYINRSFAEKHSLAVQNFAGEVTLAETSVRMPVFGQCIVNLYMSKAINTTMWLLMFSTILVQMLSSERRFFKNTKR